MTVLTRREFAAGVALLPLLAARGHAQTALPKMLVAKVQAAVAAAPGSAT